MILSATLPVPPPYEHRKEGDLDFRCVRGVQQGRRFMGVALTVPGFGGGADFKPWLSAGLFEDFEIWACDAFYASGDITLADRMFETATNIANAIRAGAAPTPDVLFGFSAAGYLAWLVDHILGGEQRQIVINDAAPVHRVGYRQTHTTSTAQNKILNRITESPSRPGKVLLIIRAASDRFIIPGNDRIIWAESDGLSVTIEVTALDHMEMNELDIYRVIEPHVTAFNNGKKLPKHMIINQNLTFGGRVSSLFECGHSADRNTIEILIKEPLNIEWRVALGGLLYLALQHIDSKSALHFIRNINQSTLNFRDFLYAEFLITTIHPTLGIPKTPNCQIPRLGSQQSVDAALGLDSRYHGLFATAETPQPHRP